MPSPEEKTAVTVAEDAENDKGRGSRVNISLGEDGAFQAHIQLDLKIDLTAPKNGRAAATQRLVEGGEDETKEAGRAMRSRTAR